MKIISIKDSENKEFESFLVEIKYSFLERLFGKRNEIKEIFSTDNQYTFGKGLVYLTKDNKTLGNFSKIGTAIDFYTNASSINKIPK